MSTLDPAGFKAEYQLDGQRVHAIERVFGLLPGLEGGGARIETLMPQLQRLRDDIRVLKERPGFDAEPYLREWPELAGSQVDLWTHHLLIGRFLASAIADQRVDCQPLARLC